jgi:hypothetical protein
VQQGIKSKRKQNDTGVDCTKTNCCQLADVSYSKWYTLLKDAQLAISEMDASCTFMSSQGGAASLKKLN